MISTKKAMVILMKKIYLSPSDQISNTYPNTALYNGHVTSEAEQMRRVADALERALIRNGFTVKNNQISSMASRVSESNSWKSDMHVCIHSNGCNGVVSGTRMFSYDTHGEGYKACKKVFDVLAPITPGTSENIKAYPSLYEIRNSDAICVYIEVDFHDVPDVAKWIIANVDTIGEAICQGICDYYGDGYFPPEEEKKEPVSEWVEVGSYLVKEQDGAIVAKPKGGIYG